MGGGRGIRSNRGPQLAILERGLVSALLVHKGRGLVETDALGRVGGRGSHRGRGGPGFRGCRASGKGESVDARRDGTGVSGEAAGLVLLVSSVESMLVLVLGGSSVAADGGIAHDGGDVWQRLCHRVATVGGHETFGWLFTLALCTLHTLALAF
jgi:hypothetical protein